MNRTIVAPATPPGRGAIGVIRISGPATLSVMQAVIKRSLVPRYATLAAFFDSDDSLLDRGIAIFFPSPHSFTGEDVLELHTHGGVQVVESLVRRLLEFPDVHVARPGEFSERAFLQGKIDLVQAEAIADLIDAETTEGAKAALRSLEGGLSEPLQEVQQALTQIRSAIEATIDFSEEVAISDVTIQHQIRGLSDRITELLQQSLSSLSLREGRRIVFAGVPNVGKSSLFNELAQADLAIVSPTPGTTRDLLRAHIAAGTASLELIDCAGLQATNDPIEQQGIERSLQAIQSADQLVWMVDSQELPLPVESADVMLLFRELKKLPREIVIVRTKIDLVGEQPGIAWVGGIPILSISTKCKQGIELLRNLWQQKAKEISMEGLFLARQRHVKALREIQKELDQALLARVQSQPWECIAEHLRSAQRVLDRLRGTIPDEALLHSIFSQFCLGK